LVTLLTKHNGTSVNALDLHSGGVWFESWLGKWPLRLIFDPVSPGKCHDGNMNQGISARFHIFSIHIMSSNHLTLQSDLLIMLLHKPQINTNT